MRAATLVYCIKKDAVLLGMKKRGFGVGKLNGYGGKVHENETITEAAVRELEEEAGITAKAGDLKKVAEIDFFFPDVPKEKGWDQTVHVYFLKKWKGEPAETEEMKPEWHMIKKIPLEKMWVDDSYWLRLIFEGKQIKAGFVFDKSGNNVVDHTIAETSF
jgi:8-oxo-dGTP pyrophosphatase MutT (NUDIX family)